MAQVFAHNRFSWSNVAILPGMLILFLILALPAFAGQASLAWDGNGNSATAGYMLHYGQASRNYTSTVDVGTRTTYSVAGLLEGKTYFYAVTAYDASRTESGYSNEASSTVPFAAPLANFSSNVVSGIAPLAVGFSNTSTGTITAYSWSFGDGTSSPSANPTHSYAGAGTYAVSLTVTGPGGSNTMAKPSYIVVTPPVSTPPTANFNAAPTSGTAPLAVAFSNQSTGTLTAYAWNFGDGTTSTAANPTHSYAAAGSYTVTLTVSGGGVSNTKTRPNLITVSAPTTKGSLTGSATASSASVNLSSVGTTDWAHWSGYDHKASGSSKISTYTRIGTGTVYSYTGDLRTLSWIAGTPTASGSNSGGVYIAGIGNGFQVNAPADTSLRKLSVYVGGWMSGGKLTAHLSDNSAVDFVHSSFSGTWQYNGVYTLTYKAASAGQTISVKWTQASGTGLVTLQGAALAPAQ